MKLQDIARELRRLRKELEASKNAHPAKWAALADEYDRHLLTASAMLQVASPPLARGPRVLVDEARGHLEDALAKAGLEVRVRPMLEGTAG